MGKRSSVRARIAAVLAPITSGGAGDTDGDLENANGSEADASTTTTATTDKVEGDGRNLEGKPVGGGRRGRRRGSLNATSTSSTSAGGDVTRTSSGRVVKRNPKFTHSFLATGTGKKINPPGLGGGSTPTQPQKMGSSVSQPQPGLQAGPSSSGKTGTGGAAGSLGSSLPTPAVTATSAGAGGTVTVTPSGINLSLKQPVIKLQRLSQSAILQLKQPATAPVPVATAPPAQPPVQPPTSASTSSGTTVTVGGSATASMTTARLHQLLISQLTQLSQALTSALPTARNPSATTAAAVLLPTTSTATAPTTFRMISAAQARAYTASLAVPGTSTSSSNQATAASTSASSVNLPLPPVGVSTPRPPNFQKHVESTLVSLLPHQTFTVRKGSREFQEIERLVSPCTPVSIQQVASPDLFQRFKNSRKEMLRTKSEDLNLLSKLYPTDMEVLRAGQLALQFKKDKLLTTKSGRFSPNEALLFHCTRDPKSLESILTQGLDDRLGYSGVLGKGIYFTDDTEKAIIYDGTGTIIIFAVLLGDCLALSQDPNNVLLVREPEKEPIQMRCATDRFFDSITAKSAGGYNEYVIYNRYQCCPLYLVKFDRNLITDPKSALYVRDRRDVPAIAWRTTGAAGHSMPNQALDGKGWPFFAETVFNRMGVVAPDRPALNLNSRFNPILDDDDLNQKVKILVSLGFLDEKENRAALEKYAVDLNQAVMSLVGEEDIVQGQPRPSFSRSAKPAQKAKTAARWIGNDGASTGKKVNGKRPRPTSTTRVVNVVDSSSESEDEDDGQPHAKIGKLTADKGKKETCDICFDDYASFDKSPQLWRELQCSHRLCSKCYSTIETTRSTMAGISHTFVKCPFCQATTGIEVGTCPTGQMDVATIDVECTGYPGVKTIQISYVISTGQYNLHRIAYLPDNQEGNEILKLLQTAWDRRICFMIGTSVTTGQQNVPVWNIHHKTSTQGGVQTYGYPDPGYFQRVRAELKAYGIE